MPTASPCAFQDNVLGFHPWSYMMLQGESETGKVETLNLKLIQPLDPEEELWECHPWKNEVTVR